MGAEAVRASLSGTGAEIVALPAPERRSARMRVVDAALRCLARQGIRKTTIDDLAREAGVSRATIYRSFPRGKDDVLAAVVDTEVARLFSSLAITLGEATDLESMLVDAMVQAAQLVGANEALAYLCAEEPEWITPHLAFDQMDAILERVSLFAAPFFGRWLDSEQSARAGEFATRIVVHYLASPATGWNLSDPVAATHLVRTYVLPGIDALRRAAPVSETIDSSKSKLMRGESTHGH